MQRLIFALTIIASAADLPKDAPKYTGPGSCASPSCHGGVAPRSDTSVWQNEYSTWVVKDKHANAYSVLTNPVATRMAKILGLKSADTAPKCLACHALDVPDNQRARTFDSMDGVSCESCHGPASNWLGPHTTKDSSKPENHQEWVNLGMRDLRDPVHRTSTCLECHLGTKDKFVDHEMIAAGHPDLYFELASFQSVMPRHWKLATDKDPWVDVRDLAIGGAVQLRDQLKKVARDAQGPVWPEYANLDCFACHHSLTPAMDSWRQERGYPGHRPGNPPWNLSRYIVFKQVVNEVDRGSAQQLSSDIEKVYALVTALAADRSQIAAQATAASEAADKLVQKMTTAPIDAPMTQRLMKAICADADNIAAQDERSAEQSAMVLDSLYVAYSRNAKVDNADRVHASIQALFKQFEDPSSYNGPKFAQALRAVGDLLK
ncbi:MAG: cytochrome c family protein [Acidobacteriia bacterium]|nr:cytochrome c family protein [Terriglobia bacterium]